MTDRTSTPLRVLIVTNMWPGERHEYFGVFVQRQVESLRAVAPDWTFDVFTLGGYRGRKDYLAAVPRLRRQLTRGYDVVHAHYGFSGATAALAGAKPLVITLHGGDVNIRWQKPITKAAARRAALVIAVSERLRDSYGDPSLPVISCGVAMDEFRPIDRAEARARLGIPLDATVALFPAGTDVPIKDYPLFLEAMARCADVAPGGITPIHLGVAGQSVPDHMAAADVVVLTSKQESGPLVVKEAIACGIPVVAVDVGDVPMTLAGLPDCAVTTHDPDAIAAAVRRVLTSPGRGRSPEKDQARRRRVYELGLDEASIARRMLRIYTEVAAHPGRASGSTQERGAA